MISKTIFFLFILSSWSSLLFGPSHFLVLDIQESNIQDRLDQGENPVDLVKEGIALEELYGKSYLGGIIFYLDIDDQYLEMEGMICSPEDLIALDTALLYHWGCYQYDIIELQNVRFSDVEYKSKRRSQKSMEVDTFVGARIGDGFENTQRLISECPEGKTAAALCQDQGEGWYLPSRGELYQIYSNLTLNGLGNFSEDYYWSSTEYDNKFAWVQNFKIGPTTELQDGAHKNKTSVKVRGVKMF